MKKKSLIPDKFQTSLILQGGGALAAYEAGVYTALYFWIKKDFEHDDEKNIFDIIAGTSGGAINAAIIVSHVQHRRNEGFSITDSWQGSIRKLLDFWNYTSSAPDFTIWRPFYNFFWPLYGDEKSWLSFWNERNAVSSRIATGEAARRYYTAKGYLYYGAPNVFSNPSTEYDERFFDNFFVPSNIWQHYENKGLRKSIEKYTDFPIATTYDGGSDNEKQPRLLIVSTDVREGEAVTFDSYERKDGSRKSEYGDYIKHGDGQRTITYNEGLMVEHIMASSSVPVNYRYAMVPINYGQDLAGGTREFWDGGILSNTPLRELIQSHEDYWKKRNANNIPDLKVYVVDIWPHKGGAPLDHDGVVNRRYDLTFQEKTPHEEKIAYLIRDYIELAQTLIGKVPTPEMDKLLDRKCQSRHRNGNPRSYRELLQKVRITDVVRLERKPDLNEISFKWCDYSADTVTSMIKNGIEETLAKMSEIEMNGNNNKNACIALDKFNNIIDAEKENELLTDKLDTILTHTTASDLLTDSSISIKRKLDWR